MRDARASVRDSPAQLFPRLSTLAKLYAADVWVILDDVQFSRRDYQHRCYLPAGAALPARWLTVPVHLPAGRATLVKDARIADPALTARRVQGMLGQYFSGSPHRAAIWGLLTEAGEAVTTSIRAAEVSERTTAALLEAAGWRGGSAATATSPPGQAAPSGSRT
jgi:hypothetical protein